jgi:subtilisin-like proprotein convertase family protein
MQEVVALVKAERERQNGTWRIYVSDIGPHDTIAFEFELENLEEYERGWSEWRATPEAAAFMEKWNDLVKPGGATEIWTLVE